MRTAICAFSAFCNDFKLGVFTLAWIFSPCSRFFMCPRKAGCRRYSVAGIGIVFDTRGRVQRTDQRHEQSHELRGRQTRAVCAAIYRSRGKGGNRSMIRPTDAWDGCHQVSCSIGGRVRVNGPNGAVPRGAPDLFANRDGGYSLSARRATDHFRSGKHVPERRNSVGDTPKRLRKA
jgi:hypothetical protein